MSFLVWQPILPTPLFVVVAIVLVGFVVWRGVVERSSRRRLLAWARRGGVVLLLLLMIARPGLPGGTSQASVAELNVFFVVDTTSSSAAEDWNGHEQRLVGMRDDITKITDDLAGARFSLISFDATAIQRVPLTEDSSAVITAATTMRQEVTYYSQGSTISQADSLLVDRLHEAQKTDPNRANVVYYLGDGEQTAASTPGSFANAKSATDGGGVLGFGTGEGGRMRVFDGYGDQYSTKEYIKDKTQSGSPDAVSKIDEGNLRAIATQLGVPYVHSEAGGSLSSVVDAAKKGKVVAAAGRTASVFDLYWIPAIPFFLLLLVEVAVIVRALSEIRVPPRRVVSRDRRSFR